MNGLNLSNPKMMDVAVPANKRQGLAQDEIARRGWAVDAAQAQAMVGCKDTVLVDLREKTERQKHGSIPGSLHAPYSDLEENIQPGGMLHELAAATDRRLLFYCAFGERSAMAVRAAHDAGLETRLPYPWRHRCVEEGGWDADTLRPSGADRGMRVECVRLACCPFTKFLPPIGATQASPTRSAPSAHRSSQR